MSSGDAEMPEPTLEAIALAMQPVELSAQQRDRMRIRILHLAREAAPDGTVTRRDSTAEWIEIAPLVEIRELWRDASLGTHVSMMRMRPGGVIPAHRHTKDEDFIVLEGECHIGTYRLGAGDAHTATAGSIHGDVTTRSGVKVLIRGEYPYPAAHR